MKWACVCTDKHVVFMSFIAQIEVGDAAVGKAQSPIESYGVRVACVNRKPNRRRSYMVQRLILSRAHQPRTDASTGEVFLYVKGGKFRYRACRWARRAEFDQSIANEVLVQFGDQQL